MKKEKINQKMRDALNSIRIIAMNHPAFDEELFKSRNFEEIQKVGGEVADWVLLAIIADEGLNERVF